MLNFSEWIPIGQKSTRTDAKIKVLMGSDSADWKENRRLQALELKQKGWKQTDIAEAFGVTEGAVSQWMSRAREGGKEALRRSAHTGPKYRPEKAPL